MAEIGKYNDLTIKKRVDFGLYLEDGDDNEILLPLHYVTDDMEVGENINVFVYKDSEDRIVATTEHPRACVGEFAFLQVKAVNKIGAFLDWGLLKDLLVPFREQKMRMIEGRYYVVYVYLDDASQRIVASAKLDKFLGNKIPDYQPRDEVDILVTQRTDLGFKVIVDNLFWGMLYHDEIFGELNIGERHKAYIKCVRDDEKIDLVLWKKPSTRVKGLTERIIDYLKHNNGFMKLNDSSSPEEIRVTFECSKKDFKRAIGNLYKANKVTIEPDGVKLV